jgi:exosortase
MGGEIPRYEQKYDRSGAGPLGGGVKMTAAGERVFGLPIRTFVWGVSFVVLALLFLVWPYSHWSFTERASVLSGLARTVWPDPEWFFCIFVPFLVGWLVWKKRAELAALPLEGSWAGLGIIAVGLGFYWVGYKVDTSYPGYAAAQLIGAGLIVHFGGWKWMRALAFPWLFLVFTWPMYPLEDRISFPLRMLMAKGSSVAINLIGIDVVREGTAIYSAAEPASGLKQGDRFMLDVDAPCAGMRSLFSLVMITVIYSYISLRGLKQRIFLVLCAVPLAMLGNLARMILLAVGSVFLGVETAVGRNINGHQEMSFYHEMAGYAVFGVALGGMFAIGSLLERKAKKKNKPAQVSTLAAVAVPAGSIKMQVLAVLTLVGATLLLCGFIGGQPPLGAPGVVSALPLHFGPVQGWEGEADQRETNMLAEDVRIMRNHYLLSSGANVTITVVLSGGERRSLHRPEVCLPAQGWNVLDEVVVDAPDPIHGTQEMKMVRMLRDFAGPDGTPRRLRALNLFFYVGSEGVTTPDYYDHVLKSYLHGLTRNVNHRWALVSFFMPYAESEVGRGDPLAELSAMEELREFAGRAAAEIKARAEAE